MKNVLIVLIILFCSRLAFGAGESVGSIDKITASIKEKKYHLAIDQIKQQLITSPKNPQLYVLLQKAVESESIFVYEELFRTNPQNGILAQKLGYIYLEQNERGKAIEMFEKALELGMSRKELTGIIGQLYAEKGNNSKAIPLLEETIKSNNQDVNSLQTLEGIYSLEKPAKQKGISKKARKLLIINSLMDAGYGYTDIGEYTAAIEIYQRVLKLDPIAKETYVALADAYRKIGDISLSLHHYLKAAAIIQDEETLSSVYKWLGILYVLVNKKETAIEYLSISVPDECKELLPYLTKCFSLPMYTDRAKNDPALFQLQNGKLNEAIEIYERIKDKNDNIYLGLGVAYCVKDMFSESLNNFLNVIECSTLNTNTSRIAQQMVKIIRLRIKTMN
ncbi:tetratricopeptide repeat protein [bacterium]|nr:tetratricopeptide repeat protein [bacterium]MBU1752379.1 tetratricopeptide repeat protein [bacterium]